MTLDEKTKISVTLAITISGGLFWLSWMYFRGEANASSIEVVSKKQETIESVIFDIRDRVIRIEEHQK